MHIGTSARLRCPSPALRRTWSALFCFALLLSLAACGGSASQTQQSQIPPPQPADSGSSGSGSQPSSPSNGSSGNSGTSSPSQPSGPPGVPAGAKTTSDIQTLPDWTWCTAEMDGHPCASGLGNATSAMTPNQADPSVSGKSAHFEIGGPTPYSNALWWKSLPADKNSTHFVYDLYFYMKASWAPEALEFDVNQSMDGKRWVWGTECSYRDSGHWDIWDSEAGKWVTTDVPCPQVSENEWHHLTWTVERVDGKAHYISVELDGKVNTVDKYYNPQQNFQGTGMSVAFQMDGNYRQDPYSVWLDKVSLSAW
jgi:hypothetical protein